MMSLSDLSIIIRRIQLSRFFLQNWTNSIVLSINHHATNWKDGYVIQNSPDAHSRDGILLDSKFAPGTENGLGNCLATCATATSNRLGSRPLYWSLPNWSWKIDISMRRLRFWMMPVCVIQAYFYLIKSIFSPRKRSISRNALKWRPRPSNKSGIPLLYGRGLRFSTHPPDGCNWVITPVFWPIITNLKSRAAMKNRAPTCDWSKV